MGLSTADDDRIASLRDKIGQFPKSPGVYLMKDARGRVLYVGKAKDLRARVSSYFQDSANLLNTRGPEIEAMAAKVAGSSRTSSRPTTSNSRTTSPFPISRSPRATTSPACS